MPVLASMLQRSLDSSNAPVAYLAVAALWHLAADDGGAAVAAGGAIPPVVQLLLARRGQLISQTDVVAVGALLAIAQQKVEQLAWGIIEHNGVRVLLALIERRSTAGAAGEAEARALVYAAAALGWLAGHNAECKAAVVAAGSVRSLASLLSHSSTDELRAAADALRVALRDCTAATAAFAEAQAAPAVVGLLHSLNQEVQQQAAGVLSTSAWNHAANSADILAAGALQLLAQLLQMPGHPAQQWAAVTVCNLCRMQPEAAAAAIQ